MQFGKYVLFDRGTCLVASHHWWKVEVGSSCVVAERAAARGTTHPGRALGVHHTATPATMGPTAANAPAGNPAGVPSHCPVRPVTVARAPSQKSAAEAGAQGRIKVAPGAVTSNSRQE